MKSGILTGSLCLLTTLSFADSTNTSDYKVHILKKGDNLSTLLYRENYRPLYGKDQWVQKVLEMNHLTKAQSSKIKEGYPVILPQRLVIKKIANAKKDILKTGQASTIRHGLIGNMISKHQDIFINMGYFQNTAKYSKTSITMRENFKVSLKAQDRNYYKVGSFDYRPEGQVSITSHGTTEFSNQNTKASFRPSWEVQSTHLFSDNENGFSFGPYAKAHNHSQVEYKDDSYGVRRDRFISLGMKANKKYAVGSLDMNLSASMNTSIISEALTGYEKMNFVQSELAFDINLTKNYFVGTYWKTQATSNSDQESSNSVGFNLSYLIK